MKPLGPFKGVIGIGIAPLQGAIRVPGGRGGSANLEEPMGSTKPAKRLKFAEQANVKNPSEARAMSPHAWGASWVYPATAK